MRDQCTPHTPKLNSYCHVSLQDQYAGTDIVVIPISSGNYAIIDSEDFDTVSQYSWHETQHPRQTNYAYAKVRVREKRTSLNMHRVILDAPKGVIVDHINRNGLDNRRSNLRYCTRSQNLQNMGKNRVNKSGFKGVSRCIKTGRWIAKIGANNLQIWVGRFDTPEEAAAAYDAAAIKHHGEFAVLNFPEEG